MADLMRSVKTPFSSLTKGETLKGRIKKLTPGEILVDINAKTEAVVLEKDRKILRNLLSLLKVGDSVTVSVLNPESDFGYPVVSLRRFVDDILWEKLLEKQKNREALSAVVQEVIRGGFLVDIDFGFSAFMPNSQSLPTHAEDVIGKKFQAYILELNRPSRKIIVSQKPILKDEEFANLVKNIKLNEKIAGTVTSTTPFGIFVSLTLPVGTTVDGLIHISEISWEKTETPAVNVGQTLETVIIGVDKEAKRVDLSIKRLSLDPFEETSKQFSIEQKVSGTVSAKTSSGVVVNLNNVEGFIRKEKIPPTVSFEVGQTIDATVSEIDKKRRRIILVPILLRKTIGYR